MFERLLNSWLPNTYLKKVIERYLNNSVGDEGQVVVNKLSIIDQGGYFSARIEADVDITKEGVNRIIAGK